MMSKIESFHNGADGQRGAAENTARLQSLLAEPIRNCTQTIGRFTSEAMAQALPEDRSLSMRGLYTVLGIVKDGESWYRTQVEFQKKLFSVVPVAYMQSLEPSNLCRERIDVPRIQVDFVEGVMTKMLVSLRVAELGGDYYRANAKQIEPLNGKGTDSLNHFLRTTGRLVNLNLTSPQEIIIMQGEYSYDAGKNEFTNTFPTFRVEEDDRTQPSENVYSGELRDVFGGDIPVFPQTHAERVRSTTYSPDYFTSLVTDILSIIPQNGSFYRMKK